MDYVCSPAHTTLSYEGAAVDNAHISLYATEAANNPKNGEILLKSQFIALSGFDPFDPRSCKDGFASLKHANKVERDLKLTDGSVQIFGNGELTARKETVSALSASPDLTDAMVKHMSQAIAPMRFAGAPTIIHMDASNSDMLEPLPSNVPNVKTLVTKGKAENTPWLEKVLDENPDQDFVWAHVGAAFTQTVPENYAEQVEDMLSKHSNLKIDISWQPTNDMIAGRSAATGAGTPPNPQNVERWAKLFVKYSGRVLWGSDNIAASHYDGDKSQEAYERTKATGLIDAMLKEPGGADAVEQLIRGAFEDTVGLGAEHTKRFRLDEANRAWLEAGGPNDTVGWTPPNQWYKVGNEWKFGPSFTPSGPGDRNTYEMNDGMMRKQGEVMEWDRDEGGNYSRQPGTGRDYGSFSPNTKRNK